MRMSAFEHPDSARNLSTGDITTVGEEGSSHNVHISFFDSAVRTSTIPSRELVAKMVPSRDRAVLIMKRPLRGDSSTCESQRRIVLSRDADARRDPTGEN